MIYTVTLNPSLDYVVSVEDFVLGKTNRTSNELMFPGGKGINVSIVLNNLGLKSTLLGFVAGFTGAEIRSKIKAKNLKEDFIEINEGMSRINVKLRSNEETEINGMGPVISSMDLDNFIEQIDKLDEGDILVLAGSIPSSIPDTIYRDIMARLDGRGVMVIVDATRKLLLNVLEYHPFLIKPNNFELGEIFGNPDLRDKEEIVELAKKLQEKGARNVLVSMAGDGAVLVTEDGDVYETAAPEGTVRNSVGAGDSMVAGFIYGYQTTGDYKEAFYYGVSAGSASAFSDDLATEDKILAVREALIKL